MKIGIIGLGLIGSSIARAVKEKITSASISSLDDDRQSLEIAQKEKVIDEIANDIKTLAINSEIIIIATPLNSFKNIFQEIKPYLSINHILTDVGSTKLTVITQAKNLLAENLPYFVPAHPIAGSEQSGYTAGRANLFDNRNVILTPDSQTDLSAINKIKNLWEELGAHVVQMTAEQHDELLASTSHLPHILAYAFINSISEQIENLPFSAGIGGGFRDFTRIAASNPALWRDICLNNSPAVLKQLEIFRKEIDEIYTALNNHDDINLENHFKNAVNLKRKIGEHSNRVNGTDNLSPTTSSSTPIQTMSSPRP